VSRAVSTRTAGTADGGGGGAHDAVLTIDIP